ncbi:arabinan endo-1,5-alpha-L-arabinosidase [Bifidobacterium callitrichos]|uniref:Arabinan endo-1,5-alpha-L-arabinosidase n=1 Tax=Bifidobacterium callitrichos TaxID=762209 RepID=A0A5M9ZCB3_9BIFI|nr:glycoside hydrolase family 43 protein [Bifidobacterium callitrichos]KAA8815484.1 arabinan endo-1,5-alpha-L-arabinosidase [Bifidobacterium callitrichos]
MEEQHIATSAATSTVPSGAPSSNATPALIHDPAIIEDHGTYYIVGTHRQFARSIDLVHWEPFENNLSRDPYALLGDIWKDWPEQPENPDLTSNTWAPDVIWNETMRKWCMYLSVNGHEFRSVIVLLTADRLDGDWTYVGPVVYSGFSPDTVDRTDVPRVLGEAAAHGDLSRYMSLKDTRINAIDAAPIRCTHGELWMSFGSWFGGIWMFKLDPATGLRDYRVRYPLVHDASDPYYGVKVAGGYWNSGEGSYFVRHDGWWYLFMSYGWLGRTGGYQVRLFRSRNLIGPYVDQNGNPAISNGEIPDNHEKDTGIRLTSSVEWGFSPAHERDIEASQGHNSVLTRSSDGRLFLVYHTRFVGRDDGEYESHIRELLPTADGWLTAAPFLYQGGAAVAPQMHADCGPALTSHPSARAGRYELVRHDPHTFFNGIHTDDGAYFGVNRPESITLEADGRVTSGEAIDFFDTPDANLPRSTDGPVTRGSWRLIGETPAGVRCCASDMAITIDGVTYTGVFAVLPDERDHTPTLTFSAIGGNQSIWGARVA